MKNQDIIDTIMTQLKKEIEKMLPDYQVIFGEPISDIPDKHVMIFLYDIERIVTLDYSLYHTGSKLATVKNIPTDIKFLITIFDKDNRESANSLVRLYSRLHKPHFFDIEHETFEPPKIILESKGPDTWNKLFPQSHYRQSIPIIVSGVVLAIDD